MGAAKLRTEPLQNSCARENSDWTDSLAVTISINVNLPFNIMDPLNPVTVAFSFDIFGDLVPFVCPQFAVIGGTSRKFSVHP